MTQRAQLAILILLAASPAFAAVTQLLNPSTDPSSRFGAEVKLLANGNVVVTDPILTVNGKQKAGAVYLFNGSTGALISTLTGTAANEAVGGGGIGVLPNGNFVVFSNYGAVDSTHPGHAATFVNGTTGLNGVVSMSNSLVQIPSGNSSAPVPCITGQPATTASTCQAILRDISTIDPTRSTLKAEGSPWSLGFPLMANEIFTFRPLSTGNYLILGPGSGLGGAVTFGNGTTGISGAVSGANSLIGASGDVIGAVWAEITPESLLSGTNVDPDGDYQVYSSITETDTFGSGAAGAVGSIPTPRSLRRSVDLGNGNYAMEGSSGVTLVNGATMAPINTLAGGGIIAAVLGNGNYVVRTPGFGGGAGAVTFVNGVTGLDGAVSASNSLVGSSPGDSIGSGGVVVLKNGNYVVISPSFGGEKGAVTFGNGTTGTAGAVNSSNSLVGNAAGDAIGSRLVTALANSNYVVASPAFGGGKGAATFGNGRKGTAGIVNPSNSLVGAATTDQIASGGIKALSNGSYVVSSPAFGGGVGAATFGNGTTGVSGTASASNSLVGSAVADQFASSGIQPLANGSYVVVSPAFADGMGAVTFGSATTGVSGAISSANSLMGSRAGDKAGGGAAHSSSYPEAAGTAFPMLGTTSKGVVALTNGNYVVMSPDFNGGIGAATFGNGATGVTGVITSSNSLAGSVAGDHVSGGGVSPLPNGNYVVLSPLWSGQKGAATFGNGTTGISGTVSTSNSLAGASSGDLVGFTGWSIRGSLSGSANVTSASLYQGLFDKGGGTGNSLADLGQFGIGKDSTILPGQITVLSNGDYVVMSPWFNGELGAATWGSGANGVAGTVSASNSILGSVPHGYLGAAVTADAFSPDKFAASGMVEMARRSTQVSVYKNPLPIDAPPQITLAGIGHAANYAAGKVAPGEIIVVYGQNFGSALAQMQVVNGQVNTTLGDTRIYFDGTAAPMIYSVAGVLSCVVPYGVTGKLSTRVQVEYKGLKGNTITVPVVGAVPGIFSLSQAGTGPGAILNQDYSVNGASNPAAGGSVVMAYATGEGKTDVGVDGEIAPMAGPWPAPVLGPWTATVGGVASPKVWYAGAAPGYVGGVFQLNIQIPNGLAPGNQELIIKTGSFSSQSGLTVALK